MDYKYRTPSRFRPRGLYFKQVSAGVDLPAGFLDDLRSIDTRLCLVWHPYRVEMDNVTNCYMGKIEDPRFAIEAFGSEEVWGWVLRNPDNSPIPENLWHIWEAHDHGYSHVTSILSKNPNYLKHLVHRLFLQTKIVTKYGPKKYFEILRQGVDKAREEEQQDLQALNNAVLEENKWLVNSAMENLSSGRIAPTNPTKDTITSFAGQKNRSRIVRPLSDTEGGLVLPDQWRQS